MTKIYVTKYAVSTGIYVANATIGDDGTAFGPGGYFDSFNTTEYAFTEKDAKAQFRQMKKKRVEHLSRQLKKVRAMNFTIKDSE